jgi:hypothetical protein
MEDNIKMDITESVRGCIDWIQLALDKKCARNGALNACLDNYLPTS